MTVCLEIRLGIGLTMPLLEFQPPLEIQNKTSTEVQGCDLCNVNSDRDCELMNCKYCILETGSDYRCFLVI